MTEVKQLLIDINETFYQAFRQCDLTKMKAIWSQQKDVSVIHPGWSIINGVEDVIISWQKILMSGNSIDISISDVQVNLVDSHLAYVTNIEELDGGQLAATNIYVLESEGWKMIHHQASPVYTDLEETSNGQVLH